MADSTISFLLNKLSELLSEERRLLRGLEREVQSIRGELLQMKEFLRGTMERDENPEWIGQLREIEYDVEDVLDKYMLRFQQRPGANGRIKKAYTSIKNLPACHRIANDIKRIRSRLQGVFESQKTYKDVYASIDQGSSSILPRNECYDGRGDALFLEDDEVLGIEKPKKQLLDWIKTRRDGLEVISVVGMGGLGKTTLVKKVYDDESIKMHFKHRVWISAPEYKDDKHMLESLIRKLGGETKQSPPPELEGMTEGNMKEFIFNFLRGKKYIIVLDDVWNISKWNVIRPALPKRGTHGCVVIATRSHIIGNDVCSETDHVYELKLLPQKESRELFYKKAFPRDPCPDYIREYAEKILKKCQGLPLAISVIGGFLATKQNRAEDWEIFERSLGHELKGGGSLEKLWKQLISLSYNDLPYYLKYCYLYLSIFPEDSLLEKELIIRLWIAEGFVQAKPGKTLEEVAVDYLGDLFSRSLIQVAMRHIDGRARAFHIHDLLRDYIVLKSREHNIVTICDGEEMQWPSRVRRIAIKKSFEFSQNTYNLDWLRSLILLCSGDVILGIINELVGRCKLLKVLEMRGAPLETIPNGVFKLYYLKHLSLRNSKVKLIPMSIKYLVNLETLDLKNCSVTELPEEILELHKLRHLLAYKYGGIQVLFDSLQSFTGPCDIGRKLTLLLKLSSVDATESKGMKIVREIGELRHLLKLGIAKLRSEDGKELCSSIAKLELDYSIGNLEFLRSITLKGWIEKVPEWIRCLKGLTYLGQYWSRLREDPLEGLQDLPNLARLDLHGAYVEGLRFKAQGFKKLKKLGLDNLKCMKWVIVEEGSMPSLERWDIWDCKLVRELPQGIEHLPRLQLLQFGNMEDEFVQKVVEERRMEDEFVESVVEERKNGGGVHSRLAHIPHIHFLKQN